MNDLIHRESQITRVQCTVRGYLARRAATAIAQSVIEKIFDPRSKRIYFYNKRLDKSRWTTPLFLRISGADIERVSPTYTTTEAAIIIQKLVRRRLSQKCTRRSLAVHEQEIYDQRTDSYYYYNRLSKTTSREQSKLWGGETRDEYLISSDASTSSDHSTSTNNGIEEDTSSDNEEDVGTSSHSQRSYAERKYPRSRMQQLVDEAEDSKEESIALDLSNLGAPRVSSRIYDLVNLTSLNLSRNRLDRISPDLGDLHKLQSLDISHNIISALPSELFYGLQSLSHLNMSHNKFERYTSTIYLLRNLQEWNISNNALKSVQVEVGDMQLLQETKEWEVGIGMFGGLEVLDVSHNALTHFPEQLERCTNLASLDLSYNQISSLHGEVGRLEKLETVNISGNLLTCLPDSCGRWVNLNTIFLNKNKVIRLPTKMLGWTKVSQINIEDNCLQELPTGIFSWKNVRELLCSRNNISEVSSHMGSMTKLKVFAADTNQIELLPRSISKCKSLSKLSLRDNCFESIPEGVTQLFKLKCLDMSHNKIQSLKGLGTLFSLESISFANNCIHEAEEAFRLSRLQCLVLSENNLTSLSGKVGDLQHLRVLDLRANQITHLDEHVAKLHSLHTLEVSHNRLTSLPDGLARISSLQKVSLEYNCFEERPDALDGMKHILHFDLSGCPVASRQVDCFLEAVNNELGAAFLSCVGRCEDFCSAEQKSLLERATELVEDLEGSLGGEIRPDHASYFRLGISQLAVGKLHHKTAEQANNQREKGECVSVEAMGVSDSDSAQVWFKKAIASLTLAEEACLSSRHGRGAEIYYSRALCSYYLNKYNEAIHDLNRTLSIRSDHLPSMTLRAKIRLTAGQFPQAHCESTKNLAEMYPSNRLREENTSIQEACVGDLSHHSLSSRQFQQSFEISREGFVRKKKTKSSAEDTRNLASTATERRKNRLDLQVERAQTKAKRAMKKLSLAKLGRSNAMVDRDNQLTD